MKLNLENLIKIILSILLVICLFHMPYDYYQLFRYIAMVGFAILAYYQYEKKNIPLVILFAALVLLFQPIIKVPMGRQSWIMIDLVVAIGLVVSIFLQKSSKAR